MSQVFDLIKIIASRLPLSTQNSMKRMHFSRQIKRNTFFTDEAEFARLSEWVGDGDWVIDIGANIGHYTLKLSSLVGDSGRVIAFEPVIATFELLASNVASARAGNVSLFNAASSDKSALVQMEIPTFDSGLDNYYMANISGSGNVSCLTLAIDSLELPNRIAFVKIDAEGHELHVLAGMKNMLERDKPVLVVELSNDEIIEYLTPLGFECQKIDGSSNLIFTPT